VRDDLLLIEVLTAAAGISVMIQEPGTTAPYSSVPP
jgi:hypothetical protein